jgi:competence protein ComEC
VDFLLQHESRETVATYAETTAVVHGTVADDPDARDTATRVVLAVSSVNGKEGSGKVLVGLPKNFAVAYGDTLEVRGLVELPENFVTETGREFEYTNYLHVRGVSATMQRVVVRAQAAGGWSVRGTLFNIKHAFERSLERAMPEPEVSLIEGVLLGERGGLSKELLQLFVVVGLIHIVVLSGSNIAIVSEGVFRLLGVFLPRRATLVAGFAAIVLFALMVGGGAATLRAVVMGSIAILARYLRRPEAALRALGIAGVAILLWSPLYILDQGFILSMLATFGLIVLGQPIENKLTRLPAWQHFNLRSIVATTLAVELFILPALLYYSGVLSFVSLPANALLLPLVPLVMFLGFFAGVAGLLHPALALVPALGASLLLKFVLWVVQSVGTLPYAATVVAPFPWWVAVLVYVPLTFVALRTYSRTPTSLNS